MARRQVSIFINGNEVENTIKGITNEKKKLVAELNRMTVGSEEYLATAGKIKGLNGILDEHRKGLSNIGNGYNLLSTGGLTKLAGLAAGAFSADVILSYGRHLFDLSGQMQLLEQKARTVFGEVFPQVTAEAEKNATAMGLTTSQYINAAAAAGDLLIPMGFTRKESADLSSQLVNLSGALSEWTGGQRSATEVSSILSKAILGEREELKSLGISISEEDVKNALRAKGLQNLTGTYKQQAEAIASVELILAKSTDAQTAFANNSDTLVRRQEAEVAKLASIGEKLATTLFPVFEKLVGLAGVFTDTLSDVADGITGLINPSKAANDAFTEQAARVSKLEAELPPLLDRYEELKGKSNLTKTEQAELGKVIQRIGEITPGAITQIDQYGRVLSINAGASREFLAAEQARLKFLNKDAVATTQNQVAALEKQLKIQQQLVNSGQTVRVEGAGFNQQLVRSTATPQEIDEARRKVAQLAEEIKGAKEQLKVLTGEVRGDTGTAPPATTTTTTKSGSSSKAKAVQKEEEDVQKILEKFRLENRLLDLDEDQKKIETLKAKYDKEIAELIKLEAKKVKGATDARLQLEQQKEDAVDALLDEIQQKRTAKDEENLQKLLDKATEAANADLEAKQAFQQQLDDFTLTEYEKALLELDKHHSDLLALAEKYHRDDSVIEEAYQKQKSELAKQYADKQNKELVETEKKKYETIAQAYQGYAAVLGGAIQGLDAILGQHTAASKVLALAQIAFKTAEAIASGIAASAGVPFPGNLVAIGTTVATVLGNFAAAKKIFNDAPSIPQKYTGGFFDVTGETDGRAYNAQYIGSPGTGLLPNRPVVLASEHGAEYFVANQDLRNPVVLNYVRAIENIRAARTGSVPQFAEGGLSNTPGTDTTSATLLAVMVQFLPLLQQLNTALSSGIKAEIEDDTVIGINNRFKLLNRASGGVL